MERIAVFAGSFDPFTLAHLSIAKRASSLFDRIFIVVAQNVNKKSLFPVEVRMRFIQKAVAGLRNISVESYSGLTVDFAKKMRQSIWFAAFVLRRNLMRNATWRGTIVGSLPK